MKRRKFLKMGAAGLASSLSAAGLLSWVPRSYAANINITYYVTEGFITQPDGVDVYFRGFSDNANSLSVPAQSLIVQEGDTLNITIVNTLNDDHSYVIDGMADTGRIRGGDTASISFTADKPGTYMFYDDMNAPYNRLVGLHGGLAIMPNGSSDELYAGSRTFKQQYFWVITDIDPVWHDDIRRGRTPPRQFTPYYFTINGLSMRVPGHPDYADPNIDSGYDPRSRIEGKIGDRALIRCLNAGMCKHSLHWHANHVEWLARNGRNFSDIWEKDTIQLPNNKGKIDVIYPFDLPPNAYPAVSTGHFPMHAHDEMTQTAGGGLYQFGLATTISFK
jgi:FtsP/CotA-like multicopper oxidase with cupredoxin domain